MCEGLSGKDLVAARHLPPQPTIAKPPPLLRPAAPAAAQPSAATAPPARARRGQPRAALAGAELAPAASSPDIHGGKRFAVFHPTRQRLLACQARNFTYPERPVLIRRPGGSPASPSNACNSSTLRCNCATCARSARMAERSSRSSRSSRCRALCRHWASSREGTGVKSCTGRQDLPDFFTHGETCISPRSART